MNCRVLPQEKPESVTATLKQVIADEQVSVAIVGDVSIGPPSPVRAVQVLLPWRPEAGKPIQDQRHIRRTLQSRIHRFRHQKSAVGRHVVEQP